MDGNELLNPSGTSTTEIESNYLSPERTMPSLILMLLSGEYSRFDKAYTTAVRLSISYMPYRWFNTRRQLMYRVIFVGVLTNREFGKNLGNINTV